MKINAAIIGTGIGEKHLEAIDGYRRSEVKIICEKNIKKIDYLKKKYPNKIITSDEKKIFDDKTINFLSIASYDDDHYKQIIKGIKNNMNIVVEKPMCLTFNELEKIHKFIKKSSSKLISNLVLRTSELFIHFKNLIDKKKIIYIEADYLWGRSEKLYGWRSKVSKYSIILGAAIHMIDLITWFISERPIYVTAFGSDRFTNRTGFKKKNNVILILEFKNNIIAKVNANALARHPHFHAVKIFQKDKTLIHDIKGSYSVTEKNIVKINKSYPDKKNRKNLIRNYIDNIILKKKFSFFNKILKQQIDLMSISLAAEKSLMKKKKIKIKYL